MIETLMVTNTDAVIAALAHLPSPRRWRTRLRLAAGMPIVQVKRIDSGSAPKPVADVYFLRVSGALDVITAVTRDGERWAAAYDRTTVDSMIAAAKAAGFRVMSVEPMPGLMPPGFRRSRLGGRSALAWYPRRRVAPSRRVRIAAMGAAALLAMASAATATAAPALRNLVYLQRYRGEDAASRVIIADAARAHADLIRVSRQLSDNAAFEIARPATALLLSDIYRALPESAFVVTVRIDASEGSITAITPDAAALLTAVAAIPGISAARVSGALTTEVIGGRRYQRATIRFRRSAGRR